MTSSTECIKPATACVACQFLTQYLYYIIITVPFLHFGPQSFHLIGHGFWDLSFIDHSDSFKECSCWADSDIYNNCGNLFDSNTSLCEEKQFQAEVLTGKWLWDDLRYRDFYIYNVTNPGNIASGDSAIVQEMNPVALVDRRRLLGVDRAMLDEKGVLAFSTDAMWTIDASRRNWQVTGQVIVPHYVFATMLANGMNIPRTTNGQNMNRNQMQGYPTYYPLFTAVDFNSCFFTPASSDYISSTYANGMFPMLNDPRESYATSYFSSERLGLQGLSFIRSVWNDVENHCGYDRDCVTGPKPNRISMTSQPCSEGLTNLEATNCNPSTLKYAAQGLEFGVTSMRWMAGASYFGIEEAGTGDEKVWDYTTFNKAGTIWPAVNEVFFVLYDVVLVGAETFWGIPAIRWSLGKHHNRAENCGASGGDSAGIDCDSPAGLVNVGPSFDTARPGPIYLSGDVQSAITGKLLNCPSPFIECSPQRNNGFELLQHGVLGFRIGYRHSYALSIRVQPSNNLGFSNAVASIPLYLKKEYFYVGQWKMYRLVMYSRFLSWTNVDWIIGACIHCFSSVVGLFWFTYKVYTLPKLDISSPYADTWCS